MGLVCLDETTVYMYWRNYRNGGVTSDRVTSNTTAANDFHTRLILK